MVRRTDGIPALARSNFQPRRRERDKSRVSENYLLFDDEDGDPELSTQFRAIVMGLAYYHRSRLHLSLNKDSPDSRSVLSMGRIVRSSEVGGLHHRYDRVA
jgi:hypothetical protein